MGTSTGKFTSPEINSMANNRNNRQGVIDLTESFTLADHNRLNDMVINLDTDDSIREENIERPRRRRAPKRRHSNARPINPEPTIVDLCTPDAKNKPKKTKKKTNNIVITEEPEEPEEKKAKQSLGTCPICFEDFGSQQLAATKCGHVFCLTCIKKALKNKTDPCCPICRTILKGKNKHHPIFLT